MICGQHEITLLGAIALSVSAMIGPGLVTSKSHDSWLQTHVDTRQKIKTTYEENFFFHIGGMVHVRDWDCLFGSQWVG